MSVSNIVKQLLKGAEVRLTLWIDVKKVSETSTALTKGQYLVLGPSDNRDEMLPLQQGVSLVGPVTVDLAAKRIYGPVTSFKFVVDPFAAETTVTEAEEQPAENKAGA